MFYKKFPDQVDVPKGGSALCSPGPIFPGSYIPRSYVPRYLCSPVLSSPVPIFPGSYVPPNLTSPMFPGSYVPQYLCSPRNNITNPMFPGSYVPRALCSPGPMFPLGHRYNFFASEPFEICKTYKNVADYFFRHIFLKFQDLKQLCHISNTKAFLKKRFKTCFKRLSTCPKLRKNGSNTVFKYRQTSNIRRNLVSNKLVDHLDVVGAPPVGVAPTTSSFSTEHMVNGLGKDNCKTRRLRFKFCNLVPLILEVLRYFYFLVRDTALGHCEVVFVL